MLTLAFKGSGLALPDLMANRWQASLSILGIDEIKSVPGNPTSHPFVERVIGTTRREYLDHMLFFNERDLQKKLDLFQTYYNEARAHSSFEMKTPKEWASDEKLDEKVVSIDNYRWQSHCNDLYQLPVAAYYSNSHRTAIIWRSGRIKIRRKSTRRVMIAPWVS